MIPLKSKSKNLYATCQYMSSDEVVLNAGFSWIPCANPKRIFAREPAIQALLEEVKRSTGEGSNICTRHIVCNSIEGSDGSKIDAQSVAASIVHGKLMSGNLSWVTEEGKLLKELTEFSESALPLFSTDNNEEEQKIREIVRGRFLDSEKMKLILKYAHHFHKKLGGDNQYRLEIPHHVDTAMTAFGFVCVETDDYDLSLTTDKYPRPILLSSKMGIELIHTALGSYHRTRGSKIDRTKEIIMSNTHVGSTAEITNKPKFDILMVFQHTPFLACGIVSYSNLTFRNTKGGTKCLGIPIDKFNWIVYPNENLTAVPLTPEEEKIIDEEVNRCKSPSMMLRLLDL